MSRPIFQSHHFWVQLLSIFLPWLLSAEVHFAFPTANETLLTKGGEARFFVGTTGKPWTSGSFGCVRSSGFQFHEGADIRSVQRDNRNEPIDPVLCTADGWIVYTSHKAGLSNYGKYAVVGHKIEGLEVYSLYAHLSTILPKWQPGKWIEKGEQIGVMGRTSNTRQRISKDRAHLHFELALIANHEYPAYFRERYPKGTNDHGIWNGQNLAGMNPAEIFYEQETKPDFSLRNYLRERTPLFTAIIHQIEFPWTKRYLPLILKTAQHDTSEINAYEVSFDFTGLPFQLKPIVAESPKKGGTWELSHVDENMYQFHPCRKLVTKTGQKWRLTAKGNQWMELLLFSKP